MVREVINLKGGPIDAFLTVHIVKQLHVCLCLYSEIDSAPNFDQRTFYCSR